MALTKDIDLEFSLLGRSVARIQENVALSPYTTFKIGGPARYFAVVNSTKEIIECAKWAKEKKLPILILGGGSNVLISDKGFNGLAIKVQNSKFKVQSSKIDAEAGVPLAKIVAEAADADLTGLEWAMGIPGTIGGAVCGNAGAFGKSISTVVEKVEVLNVSSFKFQVLRREECKFSYRNSLFSASAKGGPASGGKGNLGSVSGGKRNSNLIVLSATFQLKKLNRDEVRKTIKNYTRERLESNPSGFSAGCFFKNPGWEEVGNKEKIISKFLELRQFSDKPKISAGFLVDYVGLKGKKIGDAAVSEKHANFILNKGKAKAKDVLKLADLIKEKILERYGIKLEEEVVVI